MSGIPDPGRASKAVDILVQSKSPFDTGRIACPQGGEDRWSARWLMDQMGYPTWQHFEPVIERAKTAAHDQGFNVRTLFTVDRKNTGGRPSTDYLVTRFAAYLIAMNGDPRKSEVAAAQTYFAVKTREAEVAQPAIDLADPDTALDKIIELATLAKQERAARIEAEARAKKLEAPASAWKHLASSEGDYEVADAAKVLSRDPNINIGRDRLFSFMAAEGWVYRNRATNRWKAYQTQVDIGRINEKFGRPFLHEPSGEMRVSDPTIRITPKGMEELHKRLGGSGQLPLVAAS